MHRNACDIGIPMCPVPDLPIQGQCSRAHLRELGKDDVGHLLVLIVVAGQPGQILRAFIFCIVTILILVLGIIVLVVPALPILSAHTTPALSLRLSTGEADQHNATCKAAQWGAWSAVSLESQRRQKCQGTHEP